MSIAEKLVTIAENVQKIYEAGQKSSGGGAGYDEGYADGKQAKLQEYVNMLTANGTRTDYRYLFYREGINDEQMAEIFNPSVWNGTIKLSNYMFSYTNIVDFGYTYEVDFSKCDGFQNIFAYSTIRRIKKLDVRSATAGQNGMANVFAHDSSLVEVEEFYPSTKCVFQDSFTNCSELVRFIFCSEISRNGLNMSACKKLSKESFVSIINNLSATTSGLAVTLSLQAVNKAFETSVGANDGSTSAEWKTLENTKTNWTISLV